jgi:dipeptidyl aminopeptidase/acylaminoacyl peptidase
LLTLGKPADMVDWVIDRHGIPRAGIAQEADGEVGVYWRSSEAAKWQKIAHHKRYEPGAIPVAFDGDATLIVASNIGRDKRALFRYDPEKKALGELIAEHPQVDLDHGLVYDPKKGRIVGVSYESSRREQAWFDDDWARVAAAVERALPNRHNTISRSVDGNLALIESGSDVDAGTYYLLDLERRRMERLADIRHDIKAQEMPRRQAVRYRARDGLEIPAILTLPRDQPANNLPLVVYVHGGPWVRGASLEWRDEPAFLGSLGYAVLEPHFRGSAGLGARHFTASFKQWGKAMQDDLDDGVDWLAAQGTVDASRVCIMGGSYGGYAVMMGLARDPARWKCGINFVGVTDIQLMYDVTWSDFAYSTFLDYSAREMMGDPVADAAQLKATSPIEQAHRIKAPVLMAYGGLDRRVPLVHGQKMRDALLSREVPVEWVVYAEEGHGFIVEANRYDFYRRVAAFLDKHLRTVPAQPAR